VHVFFPCTFDAPKHKLSTEPFASVVPVNAAEHEIPVVSLFTVPEMCAIRVAFFHDINFAGVNSTIRVIRKRGESF